MPNKKKSKRLLTQSSPNYTNNQEVLKEELDSLEVLVASLEELEVSLEALVASLEELVSLVLEVLVARANLPSKKSIKFSSLFNLFEAFL